MIRLSKLFKRDSQPDDRDDVVYSRSRANTRFPARNSRTSTDDPVLTEDPEHPRARHRLIGAAVMVLVAIIALPQILDSKPKATSNDIAITIVSNLPVTSPATTAAPASAPEPKAEDAKVITTPTAPPSERKEASKPTASAPTPVAAASNPPKASPPNTADKSLGLAAGEEMVATTKSNAANGAAEAGPNPSGKFVIQIGAFASEERAKGWITKLKEQKIPNYVLNRTSADGTKLFALRAGPFTDREAAESAEKKIKAMGLTPRIVEVGKP
jgi:DedD protein